MFGVDHSVRVRGMPIRPGVAYNDVDDHAHPSSELQRFRLRRRRFAFIRSIESSFIFNAVES